MNFELSKKHVLHVAGHGTFLAGLTVIEPSGMGDMGDMGDRV